MMHRSWLLVCVRAKSKSTRERRLVGFPVAAQLTVSSTQWWGRWLWLWRRRRRPHHCLHGAAPCACCSFHGPHLGSIAPLVISFVSAPTMFGNAQLLVRQAKISMHACVGRGAIVLQRASSAGLPRHAHSKLTCHRRASQLRVQAMSADSGPEVSLEKRWEDYFSDPSEWWDNRTSKTNPKYPDFKHKRTGEALWVNSWRNPSWIQEKLDIVASQDKTQCPSPLNIIQVGWETIDLEDCSVRQVLRILDQKGIVVDNAFYVSLLRWCTRVKSLAEGKEVHSYIIKTKFRPNRMLVNTIINMYAHCGSLLEARKVFDQTQQRDVYTWTALLNGSAKHGAWADALEIYHQMRKEGVSIAKFSYSQAMVLKACSHVGDLQTGQQVHKDMVKSGTFLNKYLENYLISMYAKCGSVDDALHVFEKMRHRNVVSWNNIIAALSRQGLTEEAFQMFWKMDQEGVKPDKVTFISILNACTSPTALEKGKLLHSQSTEAGYESDLSLANALMKMYIKCGSTVDALQVFKKLVAPNVISWNIIIGGYTQQGLLKEAFALFTRMQESHVTPDKTTFLNILGACNGPPALEYGKMVHAVITNPGAESDAQVGAALVSMYCKCKATELALETFQRAPREHAAVWNAMIGGYAQNGQVNEAFDVFSRMKEGQVAKPDRVTYLSILNACASLPMGKEVHASIKEAGLELDVQVGTALASMYIRCGSLKEALDVFDKIQTPDLTSWNSLIRSFAEYGHFDTALALLGRMQDAGVDPDGVTYLAILNGVSTLEQGKEVHALILAAGLDSEVRVGNSLVNMYIKCGSVEDAQRIFEKMESRDGTSWNALIQGSTQNGQSQEAPELFSEMQKSDVQPIP